MSGEVHATTTQQLVMLSPSAHIVRRPDVGIQCGMDATTAGVFEVQGPPQRLLVPVLLAAANPIALDTLQQRVEMTGLSTTQTRLLIDDLLNHGVLIPFERTIVCVVGRCSLATTIIRLCSELGMVVRKPKQGESEERFLTQVPQELPIIPVGKVAYLKNVSTKLGRRPNVLPVRIIDSSGVIGPIRRDGTGACVQCADLYRIAVDPQWRTVTKELPLNPRPNPIVEYATAARLAALLMPRYPAPGIVNASYRPGVCIEVNPFTGTALETTVRPHPICPVCWEKRST
ncbi:MAG: TOMM precursor leader peptide-binding protein [Corynebacterium sp.]|nr:TOMM precursor leader peptide-binding protein [Corynebacterium sp.]